MAADLHIHAMGGRWSKNAVNEEDLRCFFGHTFGHKWFNWSGLGRCLIDPVPDFDCPHWRRVMKTESKWVGEVSWLKAGVTGDSDAFIPEPVQAVQSLIDDGVTVLDRETRDNLLRALAAPRRNEASRHYDVTVDEDWPGWLDAHKGQKLFTVSW
jgi:hypothetical protein